MTTNTPLGESMPAQRSGSPLSDAEREFLRKISTGLWQLKTDKPRPGIQKLIDRGYCRTARMRIGPLGIHTGEVSIHITEAGRVALAHVEECRGARV